MREQIKVILFSLLLLFVALILQSTVFKLIEINGAKPDIVLLLLVFISLQKGRTTGQFAGFFSGLIEDFLSLPGFIGFYAFIRMVIGFLSGMFKGNIFMGSFGIPVLIAIVATVLKYLISIITVLIFSISSFNFPWMRFLIELIYNAVFSLLVYRFINIFKILRVMDKENL